MGYYKHNAICVTPFFKGEEFDIVYNMAKDMFGGLVTEAIENSFGIVSFFISPDGSKEGWDASNEFDIKRKKYIEVLEDYCIEYASVWYDENNLRGIEEIEDR